MSGAPFPLPGRPRKPILSVVALATRLTSRMKDRIRILSVGWLPVLLVVLSVHAQNPLPPVSSAIQHGKLLFSGQTRFAHGGPACIACHSVGGLPFPNGGALGPDLTQVTVRMGPEGIQSALNTLYFPAMVPLYKTRPLTVDEQQDLAAFLQQASAAAPPRVTGQVIAIAGLIFVLLLLVFWWVGRGRLRGVRRRLVDNARAVEARRRVTEEGESL